MQLASTSFHPQSRSKAAAYIKSSNTLETCRSNYVGFTAEGGIFAATDLGDRGTCFFVSHPDRTLAELTQLTDQYCSDDTVIVSAEIGDERILNGYSIIAKAETLGLTANDLPDVAEQNIWPRRIDSLT